MTTPGPSGRRDLMQELMDSLSATKDLIRAEEAATEPDQEDS